MLAWRRVSVVPSQQQEPIRGLCDNRSTADFGPKQHREKTGGSPVKKVQRTRVLRLEIYLSVKPSMLDKK